MNSLDSIYTNIYYPSIEKGGILKKSGAPYGPMDHVSSLDREKWLEENADRLSRMDRLSTSSQNQLANAGGGGQPGNFFFIMILHMILML